MLLTVGSIFRLCLYIFSIFALNFRQLSATRDSSNYLFIGLRSLCSGGETPHSMNLCVYVYVCVCMYICIFRQGK